MRKYKSKRKLGECICDNCGIKFEKPLSEIKRNAKLERRNFCSRSCVGHHNTEKILNYIPNPKDFKKYGPRDEYTGFRDIMRRIKKRDANFDIDLIFLKELWEKQNICVYTGVKLKLPNTRNNDNLYTASLDRIDSSKGYIKDNVQFISIAANFAKNSMSHEQMLEFCNIIYENKKPLPVEVRV